MLPKQILLLNLLSDLPAMAISTDHLDPELVARPRRWDVRNFMLTFGLVSSLFDFVAAFTVALPYLPGATLFGFAPLPPMLLASIVGLALALLLASELAKRLFFALPYLAAERVADSRRP